MSSDSDGLSPTNSSETPNDVSQTFESNSVQETVNDKKVETVEVDVPEMVREDQMKPEYRPTLDGTEQVDQDHFDDKWDKQTADYNKQNHDARAEFEAKKSKGLDAFDKADLEKDWGDRLGKSRDKGWER